MRPSSIDRLEKPIREEMNRLRIDSGFTIDQILDYLKKMDVSLSRSALGRHVKQLDEKVGSKIRELRIAAEAVRKTLDDADDGKVGALNRELAHSILMRVSTATDDDGEDVQFTPQEAMFIAKALDHLAHAEKTETDRLIKAQEAAAKKAANKVIAGVQAELKKNKQPGLSAESIASIRNSVLGVAG